MRIIFFISGDGRLAPTELGAGRGRRRHHYSHPCLAIVVLNRNYDRTTNFCIACKYNCMADHCRSKETMMISVTIRGINVCYTIVHKRGIFPWGASYSRCVIFFLLCNCSKLWKKFKIKISSIIKYNKEDKITEIYSNYKWNLFNEISTIY